MGSALPAVSGKVVIGVLSDTHGHLYGEVKKALRGVDHIIHAGDVGSPDVLAGLRAIAPVTAVRGNCDLDVWAQALPLQAEIQLGEVRVLVGHIAARSLEAEGGGGFALVISGHSHVAAVEHRDGVLHMNPGSAGPRRYGRPRTVGLVTLQSSELETPCAAPTGVTRIDAEIVIVASD